MQVGSFLHNLVLILRDTPPLVGFSTAWPVSFSLLLFMHDIPMVGVYWFYLDALWYGVGDLGASTI
jgi:hypothetical protein